MSTLNYWDTRNSLFNVKGLKSKKMWKEKSLLAENVPFHRPKLLLPWRNKSGSQRNIVSWKIEEEDLISSQKVFDNNSTLTIIINIKVRLKLLTENFVSVKLMTSHISWLKAMSGNSKTFMSLKITQQQGISSLFARWTSQRMFCCGWLSVSMVFMKQYFSIQDSLVIRL
jgi:hypothetical protein